jgi:diadenosine tetraphosphate (Ap4A) HIT family hydrolase
MVSQLHIHIIARYKNDEAWPNPIWGQGQVNPYKKEEKIKMIERLV